MDNFMRTEFLSKSSNEGFARAAVSAFLSQLDPTIEQLAEIKTAVSEAVTNAIVHGYESMSGFVTPLFTTKPELERSGMGFTVMESFMDSVEVYSKEHSGTKVVMVKKL